VSTDATQDMAAPPPSPGTGPAGTGTALEYTAPTSSAEPIPAAAPHRGPARVRGGGTPAGHGARGAPPSRLRALDGLRMLAALMVAAYHYGGRNGEISQAWGDSPRHQFPTASDYFAYGCLGVQIFFLISGFVICMSGWGRPLRDFFASRASRLLPAYWAAIILVTLVFTLPWVAYRALSPSDTLVNLTMLQQPLGVDRVLGVCWTLWAEVRFYALFALFVVLPGASRRRVVLFCTLWGLGAAIAQGAHQPVLDTVLMPAYAPYFIGGVGLYLVHRYGHDAIAWGIVAISFLVGQHYAVADLWHPPNPGDFSQRSSVGIIGVVAFGYLAVALVAVGRLRWADWRWLTVAGALTYPFYLVHEHLGWVVVRVLHRTLHIPSYATFLLTVALMLGLAWLMHHLVERRLGPVLRRALNPSRPRADRGR
jgi:peptidoglycan/LPS O-acetylase OafA/YrhL